MAALMFDLIIVRVAFENVASFEADAQGALVAVRSPNALVSCFLVVVQ